MTNGIRHHCDELQRVLADLIRHELNKHSRSGPHIVLASETGLACDGLFYGMTAARMAIWLRDEIPDWQNGPAMLVNDSQILADCGGCLESAANVTNSVAVHELAHCIAFKSLCADEGPADTVDASQFRQVVTYKALSSQRVADADRAQHGQQFIRTVLHVRWRMIQRGWCVPFVDLLDWARYCGHPAEWYRMALVDEFARLQDLPLSELQYIPAPGEFVSLFDDSAGVG